MIYYCIYNILFSLLFFIVYVLFLALFVSIVKVFLSGLLWGYTSSAGGSPRHWSLFQPESLSATRESFVFIQDGAAGASLHLGAWFVSAPFDLEMTSFKDLYPTTGIRRSRCPAAKESQKDVLCEAVKRPAYLGSLWCNIFTLLFTIKSNYGFPPIPQAFLKSD